MGDDSIASGYRAVAARVRAAAEAAERDPAAIRLVAVGKTHPPDALVRAVAAGARHLGENRVQEAATKRPEVEGATWHLIGPLQRNKAKLALEVFDVVHTVDRAKVARRLQLLLERHWPDRVLPVLLEVNVGGEEQKAGVPPAAAAELLRATLDCDRLHVEGLMTVPPFGDAESSRPYYRTLAGLRDRLEQEVGMALPELSMGMSHDFEEAIAEGATVVRVGTAIFGPRAGCAISDEA